MKKNYSILLIIITFFTYNLKNSSKKEGSKTVEIEIVTKEQALTKITNSELFNVELVGLTKDPKNIKSYSVNFSSACYCDSPSILLKEEKAYLFGYCKDALPPESNDPFYTYAITETLLLKKGLSVSLKNEKDEILKLIFNKSENQHIYKLQVIGEFPKDYIGNTVCTYFTFKQDKFEVYDCGDFDG